MCYEMKNESYKSLKLYQKFDIFLVSNFEISTAQHISKKADIVTK